MSKSGKFVVTKGTEKVIGSIVAGFVFLVLVGCGADQSAEITTNEHQIDDTQTQITNSRVVRTTNQFGHNYGEALQRAWYFYEAQRSGPLPKVVGDLAFIDPRTGQQLHNGFLPNRIPWRGDSGLVDGLDVGLDLTGGWHDAGDHVKFGLPMAFSASFTAWSVLEFEEALTTTGQLEYAKDNLRWVADYLMKAHPEPNVLYGQVGQGNIDHSIWGPPEVMPHERPAWKIDEDNPGADLAAQTSAALTIMSMVFVDDEPVYAAAMLQHAIELYDFAQLEPESRYSDSITDAQSFYRSVSGAKDDIPFAAAWLYLATKDARFLHDAEAVYTRIADREGHATWSAVWDDVRYAVYVVMAKVYDEPSYAADSLITSERHSGYFDYDLHAQNFFKFWQQDVPRTPGGMAWLTGWGSARYNTMTSFLALVYRQHLIEQNEAPQLQKQYLQFATEQVNYVLGDNPLNLSYMVGYGDNWVQVAHHRAAHGSSTNSIYEPALPRNILYGALAGGPNSADGYTNDRAAFAMTEVATDMNAGITGALAGLVSAYGVNGNEAQFDFPSAVLPRDEIFVRARIKTDSSIATEVEVNLINESAYPPRGSDGLKFRYFVDLAEVFAAGYTLSDLTLTEYWGQGNGVTLHQWRDASIYYIEGSFEGIEIVPRGDVEKQKTSQFIIRLPWTGAGWDSANDPSFTGLSSGWAVTDRIALYDTNFPLGAQLIWGIEPEASGSVVTPVALNAIAKIDSESGTGYCATVEITNAGMSVAAPTGVVFRLPESVNLVSSWNGDVTRTADLVNLIYPDWVEPIQPGAVQREFGFCAEGLAHPSQVTAYLAGHAPTLAPMVDVIEPVDGAVPVVIVTPEPVLPVPVVNEPLLVSVQASFDLYSVWAAGYCARVVVRNNSDVAVELAGLVFRLPPETVFSQTWSTSSVSRDGDRVDISFPDWFGKLAVGASKNDVGFCVTGTSEPSDLAIYAVGQSAPALTPQVIPSMLVEPEPVLIQAQPTPVSLALESDVYNDWGAGYCLRIKATNLGTEPVALKALAFILPASVIISTRWNGDIVRDGDNVRVAYPSWMPSLAGGVSQADFGFCAVGADKPTSIIAI